MMAGLSKSSGTTLTVRTMSTTISIKTMTPHIQQQQQQQQQQ